MFSVISRLKQIFFDVEFRLISTTDSDLRFFNNVQWAGIVVQWVGIFYSFVLFIVGTVIWFIGMTNFLKRILALYDEYEEEKQKEQERQKETF